MMGEAQYAPPTTAGRAARSRPRTLPAIGFLLTSMPLGIIWFTVLVTLFVLGVGTAVTWVGVPILLFTLVLAVAVGAAERARANALLGTAIAPPHRELPTGLFAATKARITDLNTWRDFVYALLLLPIGIVEFALTLSFWLVSLSLVALPLYYWALPGGAWYFPTIAGDGPHWFVVNSVAGSLPWVALGLLVGSLAYLITRALAVMHAGLARAMLSPIRTSGVDFRGY